MDSLIKVNSEINKVHKTVLDELNIYQELFKTNNFSKGLFLINNKISIIDKRNVLVLTDKFNILYVCGHRINNDYKISKNALISIEKTGWLSDCLIISTNEFLILFYVGLFYNFDNPVSGKQKQK